MATWESEQRMARRRVQRALAELRADPQIQAWRRARLRKRKRRKLPGWSAEAIRTHCALYGLLRGGRARGQRRCTKRLGSRLCGNWRVKGTTRCHLHQHAGGALQRLTRY